MKHKIAMECIVERLEIPPAKLLSFDSVIISIGIKRVIAFFLQEKWISRAARVCFSVLFLVCPDLNAQNAASEIQDNSAKVFWAGAALSNITPKIGTSINGNMRDVTIKQIHDETNVRCLVLDGGQNRLATGAADLCMVYRETLDEAKFRAHQITGIPVENRMISASHTHAGGTAGGVFQSDPDPDYLKVLSETIT